MRASDRGRGEEGGSSNDRGEESSPLFFPPSIRRANKPSFPLSAIVTLVRIRVSFFIDVSVTVSVRIRLTRARCIREKG